MSAEEPEIADAFRNESACDEWQSCMSPTFECEKGSTCPPVGWLPPAEEG